jgi:hypothetical protein
MDGGQARRRREGQEEKEESVVIRATRPDLGRGNFLNTIMRRVARANGLSFKSMSAGRARLPTHPPALVQAS